MTADLDKLRADALGHLYRETWREIGRLRDYQWRIAYYFASMSIALLVLIHSGALATIDLSWLRPTLLAVQALQMCVAQFYLEKTHEYLTQQRNIRRTIEEIFDFYTPGVYGAEPILPAHWKGVRITRRFQRLGLVVPLSIFLLLVQLFVLYFISVTDFQGRHVP